MSMRSNRHSIITAIGLIFGLACAPVCHAACIPKNLATPAPQDPVARVLSAQNACPRTPHEFVDALKRLGARMEPTMVNFVGFHHADEGDAFFFFEIVSSAPPSAVTIQRGDLLFGHFAVANSGQLVSVQGDGLTIELIAWDPDKQFYNFYELRDGSWIYQGDSGIFWMTSSYCIASGAHPPPRSVRVFVVPGATSTAVSSKRNWHLPITTGSCKTATFPWAGSGPMHS